METDKITYDDVKQYHSLFTKTPSFVLGAMIKRNTNLVRKFKPTIVTYLSKLNNDQKNKLNIVLNSEISDLQLIMEEAYKKTGKKQYKLLAESKNRNFVKINLDELKKLV